MNNYDSIVGDPRREMLAQTTEAILVGIEDDDGLGESQQNTLFLYVNPEKDKPIFSMIIPSMGSLTCLIKCLYSGSYVGPWGIFGKLTTRKMREISISGFRGMTFFHPDVRTSNKAHGFIFDAYTFFWHDLLFHCLQSSANFNRRLTHYLRNLVENVKKVLMDAFIWSMVDGDFTTYLLYKTKADNDRCLYNNAHNRFINILLTFTESPNCYTAFSLNSEINIIFAFDMLKNKHLWDQLIHHDFYKFEIEQWLQKKLSNESLQKCREILNLYPNKPPLFYALAYDLADDQQHLNALRWRFLELVNDHLLLSDYFRWTKDKFLYLKDCDTKVNSMSVLELFQYLQTRAMQTLSKLKDSKPENELVRKILFKMEDIIYAHSNYLTLEATKNKPSYLRVVVDYLQTATEKQLSHACLHRPSPDALFYHRPDLITKAEEGNRFYTGPIRKTSFICTTFAK